MYKVFSMPIRLVEPSTAHTVGLFLRQVLVVMNRSGQDERQFASSFTVALRGSELIFDPVLRDVFPSVHLLALRFGDGVSDSMGHVRHAGHEIGRDGVIVSATVQFRALRGDNALNGIESR